MTTSKMKTTSKIKSTSKIKMTSKMKTTLFQYRLGLVVARHCVGKNREGVKIRNSRNESYIKREAVKIHQNYNNKKFSPKSQLGQGVVFFVRLSICLCVSVCLLENLLGRSFIRRQLFLFNRDFHLSLKNFLQIQLFSKSEAYFLIKWFLIKKKVLCKLQQQFL